MAKRSLSSLKRQRQNARRAVSNQARRTLIKSSLRKVTDALTQRDAPAAETTLREASKILDRAAAHRIIHPNTAARRKSRLSRRLASLRTAKK